MGCSHSKVSMSKNTKGSSKMGGGRPDENRESNQPVASCSSIENKNDISNSGGDNQKERTKNENGRAQGLDKSLEHKGRESAETDHNGKNGKNENSSNSVDLQKGASKSNHNSEVFSYRLSFNNKERKDLNEKIGKVEDSQKAAQNEHTNCNSFASNDNPEKAKGSGTSAVDGQSKNEIGGKRDNMSLDANSSGSMKKEPNKNIEHEGDKMAHSQLRTLKDSLPTHQTRSPDAQPISKNETSSGRTGNKDTALLATSTKKRTDNKNDEVKGLIRDVKKQTGATQKEPTNCSAGSEDAFMKGKNIPREAHPLSSTGQSSVSSLGTTASKDSSRKVENSSSGQDAQPISKNETSSGRTGNKDTALLATSTKKGTDNKNDEVKGPILDGKKQTGATQKELTNCSATSDETTKGKKTSHATHSQSSSVLPSGSSLETRNHQKGTVPSNVEKPNTEVPPTVREIKSVKDISSINDISGLSVTQMKTILTTASVNFSEFTYKEEYVKKLQDLYKSEQKGDGQTCQICCENMVNSVFLECGHMIACVECGYKMKECPVCRFYITRVVRVFQT